MTNIKMSWQTRYGRALVLFLLGWAFSRPALAVPSFARQTGMDCSACHTVFPELNAFGRAFKLTGYNVGSVKWISGTDSAGNTRVQISSIPPIATMFQVSHQFTANNPLTYTAAGTDGGGTNSFPGQLSLFYAGALSPRMGAFVQATFDTGGFTFDNSDIRYADRTDLLGTDLIYGVSINNNPTVQDVWNGAGAWSFPYASPGGSLVVSPYGGTQVESLGQSVASLGGYVYWNDWVYAELSGYRSIDPVSSGAAVIQGLAPYWRVAVQDEFIDDHSLEIGTFGLAGNTYPEGAAPGLPQDSYTDIGLDAQYQYTGDNHLVTLKGSWIQEKQVWNASNSLLTGGSFNNPTPLSDAPYGTVHHLKVDGTYYYHRLLGGTVGYFSLDGNQDATAYASAAVTGSAANVPNSNGMVYELNYLPWYNTKFSLQYVAYNEFNGGVANYDGAGRDAWDNNTFMIQGWFLY